MALAISACSPKPDPAQQALNVIDATNLNDVMLSAADPAEAVAYFQRSSAQDPGRIEFRRGLAASLVRAKRYPEAAAAWQNVLALPNASHDDRVDYADALIRNGNWGAAEQTLNQVPPTVETYRRYRLEAMVADSKEDWTRADSFYQTAAGLTTTPAGVLNNWGYSQLSRGNFAQAEQLFGQALQHDPQLFTAKNNLVMARGAQRRYELPVIPMTQIERAQLLHTLGLTAIKQNDISTGKTLLREAIDTHPQYFEAAARSLAALEGTSQDG
ncbi:MAG: tetratricopeptide repeat protein [Pseudomonadota bacterium]